MWTRCEYTIGGRFDIVWFRGKEEMDCFFTSFPHLSPCFKILSRKEVETRHGKLSTDLHYAMWDDDDDLNLEDIIEERPLSLEERGELADLVAEEEYYDPEVSIDDWPRSGTLDDPEHPGD